MARSSWKFKYTHKHIYKNIFLNKFKFKKIKRIFCRNSIVPKIFSKNAIQVYKGGVFSKIFFTKFSVGFKIGEFALTRKPFSFPLKLKKKKK